MTTRFVTIDPKQMADLMATFEGSAKNWNKAMQAAISRTQTTGVARIARGISAEVNLPIAELKKQVKVKRPSFTNLVGTLSMSRKPVKLIKYMSAGQIRRGLQLKLKKTGKQTRFRAMRPSGGVTVKVRRRGPLERFPESFVQRMKSGHVGIFRRRMKGGGKRVPRLPIDERQGPTAVGVLANAPGAKGGQTILDEVVSELGVDLKKNVLSQIDRLILNPNSFAKFDKATAGVA